MRDLWVRAELYSLATHENEEAISYRELRKLLKVFCVAKDAVRSVAKENIKRTVRLSILESFA